MVTGRYDDGYISGLIKKIKNYQYKIIALGANFCLKFSVVHHFEQLQS
jgi:hypothetical protein